MQTWTINRKIIIEFSSEKNEKTADSQKIRVPNLSTCLYFENDEIFYT